MPLLQNGNPFPLLDLQAVGGRPLSLPGMFDGEFGVVIAYRGAWCPFCAAQLAGFAAEKAALDGLGVRVVAFSVEDEKTTQDFQKKLNFPFPLAHSVSADHVSRLLGAFTNESPKYLQPTAFILTPNGEVLASAYASHAVGRLIASDVVTFVTFVKSK